MAKAARLTELDADQGRNLRFGFHNHSSDEVVMRCVGLRGTMDYFVLPDSCSVPNQNIQEEHELLVSIVNKGRDILRSASNPDPKLFHSLLEELQKAAAAHFAHEEVIMEDCGYPDLASHRNHHANCERRLRQINDMLLTGEIEPSRLLLDELFDLVLDDIIRADSGFKAFIGETISGK